MVKSLFLELKFSDWSFEKLQSSGANHLIVALKPLTSRDWERLKKLNVTLTISLNSFDPGICPANPRSFKIVRERIEKALSFHPKQIYLDHFRFDGHWEKIRGRKIPGVHRQCKWCKGKDRAKFLSDLAQKVIDLVRGRAEVGYFAVPFKDEEVEQLVFGLGQDHKRLGRVFDFISPMLYHRMIKKPVAYISEYIKWLGEKTEKPVLPIIQVKDMPDDLPDKLLEEEIKQAFNEACKPPSIGVSFFSWDHAVEKEKTKLVRELFGERR